MSKLSIYQGETLSIGVTSATISLIDVKLAIVIYKRCEESHQYLNVGSELTISASDTAQFSCGEYAIEVKVVYQGRLFTSKACNVLEVMPARSKDIYNDEEDPTLSTDNAINVNIEQHDNYIEVKLMQGSGGGSGSTVVVTNAEDNTTSIKVDGTDKVTDLVRSGYVTSALSPYAKSADVANTYATKNEIPDVSGKADKSELNAYAKSADVANTYATKNEIPDVSGYARSSDLANYQGLTVNPHVAIGDDGIATININYSTIYNCNVFFKLGTAINKLIININTTLSVNEADIQFTAAVDNVPIEINMASGNYYQIGDVPTITAGNIYLIAVSGNVVIMGEATEVEQEE